MSKGSPSMIALLGLLAMAGYQNRDKLSGLLQGGGSGSGNRMSPNDTPAGGSLMDNLRQMMSGSGGGGSVGGGFAEILSRFTGPGQSAKAQSWVDTGPNSALDANELEQALDEETLAELSQKTGLSKSELLSRLSTVLPEAVDQFTPNGRMPRDDETATML